MTSHRLRVAILERDGYRCVYCGRSAKETVLEVDHVLPRARGGTDTPTNLVTACWSCNNAKGAGARPLPDYTVLTRPLPAWFTNPIGQPTPTRRRVA